MYCRLAAGSLLITVFFAGCARKETRAVQQLAIVPFDNLSPDTNLAWMGRAAATAIAYDLAPAPELHAQIAESAAQAYSMPATRALEGYLTAKSGELKLTVVLEDLSSHRTIGNYEFSGPMSGGVLPLLNQLAHQLSPAARPFVTSNAEAFRLYGEAISSKNQAADFEAATKADPHFISAYAGWAEVLLAAGDRNGGLTLLDRAHGLATDPVDRAELEVMAASDPHARVKALENLTRLTPANMKTLRELASLAFAQRDFPEAVRAYQGVARITPDDPAVWNELGYAQAFTLDLPAARESIDHYRQIAPEDPNALDSLGEINFFAGDFAAAERAFLTTIKNASAPAGTAIIKAAQSRLMTGDIAGADALFAKYTNLAQPAQRPVANYQRAQWEFLSGRRKAAFARIEQVIPTLAGDTQILAVCQLALWKLETGDAKAAGALADRVSAAAQTPASRILAGTLRAIVTMQPSPSASGVANAVALLFARKYADALPLLQAGFNEASPGSDGQIRALLAWAHVELGRLDDAAKLISIYPLPINSGDPLFSSLVFPRFLHLRSVVLAKQGKASEAKQSEDLYRKFAGDIPDAIGDAVK